MSYRPALPTVLLAVVFCVVASVVVYVVVAENTLPEGPSELLWNRDVCDFCSMHVGEPEYAAQLQTKDGRTLAFDDPGCLFLRLANEPPAVHAVYFRHYREERWIPSTTVSFVTVSPTPMGYELGAVDSGTPDSISLEKAREQVLRKGTDGERR